ncbi:S-layer homology domain-containing protein [Paenibacillus sp. LHD-117]|uniref:S-layer homology domain-containing protein n=1 Tax=Paenibacillus sp. LHD-117 TaxID=3071412 RepID=UPI0027E1BF6C|nr:S-layer homology domain-containing protein [Paenibacillus sp. LHD-117]MDQ6417910.1 S-layer homology domain-containing protein [Paenibacillus sp. LHD-117]
MKRGKGITALLLLLTFSLIMPVVVQAAASAPTLELRSSYSNGQAKVVIYGRHLDDLYAYHLFLSHDPGKVQLKQAKTGISGFSVTPKTAKGKTEFAFTKVGPVNGLNGSTELAELTFEIVSPGMSHLVLDSAELVDSKLDKRTLKPVLSQLLIHFADLTGHWSEFTVYKAAASGFVSGYSDGTFQPERKVTRAEFTVMLAKALDLAPGQRTAFADDAGLPEWARGYIAAAADEGWISGYADGTFQPNRLMSREEMTVVAMRAAELPAITEAGTDFSDDETISDWARGFVAAAVKQGIVAGKDDGTFQPGSDSTRAQAVTVIRRLFEKVSIPN